MPGGPGRADGWMGIWKILAPLFWWGSVILKGLNRLQRRPKNFFTIFSLCATLGGGWVCSPTSTSGVGGFLCAHWCLLAAVCAADSWWCCVHPHLGQFWLL
uniref:Uncharacterized protein n=1 Tax=Eutreptiella gymnastica TaxID=73025 RepID=A0A7S4GFC1_9EUGL